MNILDKIAKINNNVRIFFNTTVGEEFYTVHLSIANL